MSVVISVDVRLHEVAQIIFITSMSMWQGDAWRIKTLHMGRKCV